LDSLLFRHKLSLWIDDEQFDIHGFPLHHMSQIVGDEELQECGRVIATGEAQGVGAVLALDPRPHLLDGRADMTKCHFFCEGLRRGSPLPQFRANIFFVCTTVNLTTVGAEPILAPDTDEAKTAVRHPCG
jgi:hypothetical protein